MHVEPGMAVEPASDRGMFMGGVIVGDDMDVEIGRGPHAPADEAVQQEASREISAKNCAAKNPPENSAEDLGKAGRRTPAR
jgi:hypothetical protein